MNPLSDRFDQALLFAVELHRQQVRKLSRVPFVAHLLGVAALVLENGGTEDQAIAALLHDSVEDQGGRATLEAIRIRFGDRVARLVEDLSDSFEKPKAPWRQRKLSYIARLPDHHPDALLVSLADKLYNAESLLREFERGGDSVWQRFNGGKSGTLWYYRTLADYFNDSHPGWLADELVRVVRELEKVS